LASRKELAAHLDPILAEIHRKRRSAAYAQCTADTNTLSLTKKSTELTKLLITDQLRQTFQTELTKIGFTHLAVDIQAAGGSKGALFHKLAFSNAPGVRVTDVLSEGESRALSLASFLTELSTASNQSAIVFDDPVSSLDHHWREKIGRRLAAEAKNRQVVVFTHDLVFLRVLLNECEHEGISCAHQYIRRDTQAGICSPDLPWLAMNVKQRLGVLRNRWQAASKVSVKGDPDDYERAGRELYGLLRESWERGVSEVLLNDVVERYRPSIETKKVTPLHDITEADCKAVEAAMTECSRWIRGHDGAIADGSPFPKPDELKGRIDELEAWVGEIRQRRKK
jgi:AAA domain